MLRWEPFLWLGWLSVSRLDRQEVLLASGAIRYTGRQLCVYAISALAQWHWVAQAWQLQFCIHPLTVKQMPRQQRSVWSLS